MHSLHNLIKNEYDSKQKAATDNLNQKKNEIYIKIPRIQEIDRQIQLSGVKYNKLIITGDNSRDSVIDDLLKEIRRLASEKTSLLTNSGYPADYLEIKYECSLCNDSGFIEGIKRCSCYNQQLINALYQSSNLQLTKTQNFSCFDETFYPDTVNEARYGIPVSPLNNILNVREGCNKFIENFLSPTEKNLFFSGRAGVGKTFMCNCIANEIIGKGYTVLYQTAPILFNVISEYRLKSFKDDEYKDISYKSIFDADLLIIDDLGTESPSATRYAELLNILNIRSVNNFMRPCKTIISSNLNIKNLYEYYTERVGSRIIGDFDIYMFAGEDIRAIKRKRGIT